MSSPALPGQCWLCGGQMLEQDPPIDGCWDWSCPTCKHYTCDHDGMLAIMRQLPRGEDVIVGKFWEGVTAWNQSDPEC